MDAKAFEPKRYMKDKNKGDCFFEEEIDNDMEEEEENGVGFVDDEKKKRVFGRRVTGGGGCVSPPSCQVEKCGVDLTDGKRYHRRHKVCEVHAKAPAVIVAGHRQRFCQQCSRFHELSEFDESKRSCRRRLAGHNERRRKSSTEICGEGSSRNGMIQSPQYRTTDDRIPMAFQANSTFKHTQIR